MGLMVPSNLPAGVIQPFAGSVAPDGWVFMYGQALSRATYAALFAAIGTAYGAGDGSTTFNVPDARGRVLFGKDNMGGTAANRATTAGGGLDGLTLGAAGGGESVTLTTAEMPVHLHDTFANNGAADNTGGVSAMNPTGSAVNGTRSRNAGSGGAHKNIPPAIVVNYIIKT